MQAEKYETVKLIVAAEAKEKLLEESENKLDESVRYTKILEDELEKKKASYEYLQRQFKTVEFNLEMEKKKSWWDKLRGR